MRRDRSISRYAARSSSRVSPSCSRRRPRTGSVGRASALLVRVEPFIAEKLWHNQRGSAPDPRISAPPTPRPARLYRWDEIALERVTELISRKVVTGAREMLAQIYLKRGAVVPMHSHDS